MAMNLGKAHSCKTRWFPMCKQVPSGICVNGLLWMPGVKYVFSGVLDNLTGNVYEDGEYMGKNRLFMSNGQYLDLQKTSEALAPRDRKFKYDFSGLCINIALRAYF
jgi:hypothetical protein